MPIDGGTYLLSGSGDQSITVGYAPDIVLLFFQNNAVQDTWEGFGGLTGMGIITRQNPGIDTNPANAQATEVWEAFTPVSSYLSDVAMWARATSGVDGYALYCVELNATGFVLRYSGGFEGGSGAPVFWLAIGEEPETFFKRYYYYEGQEGPNSVDELVTTVFAVGGGGGTTPGSGSVSWFDFSVPSWCVATMHQAGDENGATYTMNLANGLSNGATNNYFYGVNNINSMVISDAELFSTNLPLSQFNFSNPSPTTFAAARNTLAPNFDANAIRISASPVSGVLGETGVVMPSSVVGGEVEVATEIDTVAVIFFCRQNVDTGFSAVFRGGQAMGYVAQNGHQAVVATGGENDTQMARFQSDSYAWVSNFSDPGTFTSGPVYGTAELTPVGFKIRTEFIGQTVTPIMYMALGFDEPNPSFFRIL